MKLFRYAVFFLLIVFCFSVSFAAENTTAVNTYPDLLDDSLLDDDFLDEEFNDETFIDGGDDGWEEIGISDPLEPMNRAFFVFNDQLYEWILRPVTDGYIWLLPRELRESFGNFFYNLSMPIRLLNTLLQGEFRASGVVLQRFLVNSTLGVYGLVDVAFLEFDLKPERADFGQTLGKWGLGEGIYLCWPLFGPSSVRDSFGLVVDAYTHPIPYFHQNYYLDLAYYTTNKLNTLSLNPDLYEDLKRFSLDPYIAARQAYYDYRKTFIEKDQIKALPYVE